MPSPRGRHILVHEDFADSLEEDFEEVRQNLAKQGKKISFIAFTDIYADCLKKKETVIEVQPVKTGRRSKRVSLELF